MKNLPKKLTKWIIAIVVILLIPLILTIRDGRVEGVGWNWTFFDFVFMFILLFSSALVYELVVRKMNNNTYRAAVGLAVITSIFLVWINAAVGLIGDDDGFNLMYLIMLAIGFVSALVVRFEPRKMIWDMLGG